MINYANRLLIFRFLVVGFYRSKHTMFMLVWSYSIMASGHPLKISKCLLMFSQHNKMYWLFKPYLKICKKLKVQM